MGKIDKILGFMAGQRIAGQRSKQKTIVGYSYNGTVLPALPESEYPYAIIHSTSQYFELYLSSKPAVVYSGTVIGIAGPCKVIKYYAYQPDYVAWENAQYSDYTQTDYPYRTGFANSAVWASYDICHKDSAEIYLAASDPIPVNPAPTLDPTALLMGWQVGNRIRGGA